MSDSILMTKKGKKRYLHFMNIAYDLFIENGYDSINAKDVIEKAGGSFSSLYKYFGNKEELFLCTLKMKHEELFGSWHDLEIGKEISLEAYLYFIGKKFLDLIVDNKMMLLYHLILSVKFTINPKIYKQLVEDIISYPVSFISNHLTQKNIQQSANIKDAFVYAQQFLYLLQAPFMYKEVPEIFDVEVIEKLKQNILDQAISCFVRPEK